MNVGIMNLFSVQKDGIGTDERVIHGTWKRSRWPKTFAKEVIPAVRVAEVARA
jgi:hypothetical protein